MKRKKARKSVRFWKNKIFYAVVIMAVVVFALVSYESTSEKNIEGKAIEVVVVEYDVAKYKYKHAQDGSPCLEHIGATPYVHPECIEE